MQFMVTKIFAIICFEQKVIALFLLLLHNARYATPNPVLFVITYEF